MRSIRWIVPSVAIGIALGAATSVVNGVPLFLGEVGAARADRSGWSQAAEFFSLILDSGWAWAASAVGVGWLASKGIRPAAGVLAGALAGSVALVGAVIAYYCADLLILGTSDHGGVQIWMIAALVLCAPLGAVGATIRRPGWIGVLAALVVPVGAALNMAILPPAESPVAVPVMLAVLAASAAATVLVLAHAVRARGAWRVPRC